MATSHELIVPVILAGGSGTRLWPLSRDERPKQFQAIAGATSMFRQTLDRVADPAVFAAPIVVGNAGHAEALAAELDAAGVAPAAVILEPAGRKTAPAIAMAGLVAEDLGLGGMLLVMPSDHFIRDPLKLQAAIVLAHAAAGAGAFVTFGITPSGPETSYGYIKQGEALGDGVFKVARFVEKPVRAAAEAMLAEGGYYWNSGMFLFPVGPLLIELRNLKPQIVEGCERALASASVAQHVIRPEASAFLGLENISIDYALMEHTARAAIVPVDPLWSDVGSWSAVWELSERDDARNAVAGNVLLHDVSDAYVRSDGPLTAVLGLSDVIVVNTGDAVIVAAKSRAQDIRHIVDAIRKRDTAK